jgi:GNAT superfamily N-acetyltransferase
MLTIAAENPSSSDAIALMEELSNVLVAITGDSGRSSFNPEDVRGAKACFVVARTVEGVAVGCGALRPLQEGIAEVKRMYARPGYRGVGSAVLTFLETEAKRLGYHTLWLETRLVNNRAVEFYEGKGYHRIQTMASMLGM